MTTRADTRHVPDPVTHRLVNPDPHAYWACEYPEMPPGPHVTYSHRCRACILHAIASLTNGDTPPDQRVLFHWSDRDPLREGRLADMLAAIALRLGDDYLAERADEVGGDAERGRKTFFPEWRP